MYGLPEGLACRSLFGRKMKNVGYEIPITAADTPAQARAPARAALAQCRGNFCRIRAAKKCH